VPYWHIGNKQKWREYPAPRKTDGLMSDHQNTVENLADLSDFAQLPANIEKQRFVELCKGYWSKTIELLDQATAMQQKRLKFSIGTNSQKF
jgi:hypothetical protein